VDTVSLTAVLAPVVLVGAAVVAVAFSTLLSAPPEDRFGQPTSLPESPPPEPPTRSEATETTPAEGRSYVRTSRVQPTCWRTRLLEAAVHDGAMVAPPAALLAGVFRQKRLYVLTSSGVDLLLLAPHLRAKRGQHGALGGGPEGARGALARGEGTAVRAVAPPRRGRIARGSAPVRGGGSLLLLARYNRYEWLSFERGITDVEG
jgi:hypothetical protein